MDIAEFLLARIAEDEVTARAAVNFGPDSWTTRPYWFTQGPQQADIPGVVEELFAAELADHIARWDPVRVLAECEAKRRTIDVIFGYEATIDGEWGCCHGADAIRAGECTTKPNDIGPLRFLALPYADHPDYQPEWSPLARA